MGKVLAFAPGGAGDELEWPDDGSVTLTARPGEGEVEAMRRRLVRLAFDVHDGPMQDLVALAWQMRSARDKAIKDAARGELGTLAAVFDGLAADLARVEEGLRALVLSAEDNQAGPDSLCVPVDQQVAAFNQQASAQVQVSIVGDVECRSESQRIALQRVLRESLSNIAKHAHADNVAITLRGTDEAIVLEIRDDGCGFEPDRQWGRQHVGLRAMGERIRLLGGRFVVASRVGGPTVVRAEIRKWQPATGMTAS